jgi:NADH dehydrogenase (ubiquinone) 1 alpha subcomplex subunit 5
LKWIQRNPSFEGKRERAMFLRRFAGPLLAGVKATTGIVGLEVVPNAREVLISLYRETLKAVEPIPTTAQYRKSVEALTQHRLKVCTEEEDWEKIEEKIQGGQVEELIVQAQDELQLIPKMAEWKPWEVPEDYKVEIIEDDDSVPSHIPIHRPRL